MNNNSFLRHILAHSTYCEIHCFARVRKIEQWGYFQDSMSILACTI